QLSMTTPALDRFRIFSLVKLLAFERLLGDRRAATADTLAAKCRIYARGLSRRGRADDASYYESIASRAIADWREQCSPEIGRTADELRAKLTLAPPQHEARP
ncbi:MAG TPA: hypothetical protein VMT58_02905, partial [Candidatus Binataceae bacterium]|nr:hypothetical protein [Candidatus Binataceae bacterium]